MQHASLVDFLVQRCLRPVSYYVNYGNATTTRGAAMKRPSVNLELHNYALRKTENLHDTKT